MNENAKMQVLKANDDYIDDLNREITMQKKEFTDVVKFRLSAESSNEAVSRELTKLEQRIQAQ